VQIKSRTFVTYLEAAGGAVDLDADDASDLDDEDDDVSQDGDQDSDDEAGDKDEGINRGCL
jgi:hypothetical protein